MRLPCAIGNLTSRRSGLLVGTGGFALLVALVLWSGTATSSGALPADWPRANHDLSSTRADPASGLDPANVASLHVAWRYRITTHPGDSGALTATPVVRDGVVYLQDMESNVVALDLQTGAVRWTHRFSDTNPGPDGVAVAGGRVYGATDTAAFALSASTGKLLWRQELVTEREQFVDMAPQLADGNVYVSTLGVPPDGHGAVYAISARSGVVRWKLPTIRSPWRVPSEAGGGGAWNPPSYADGTIYLGTANPYPYGGSRKHPNGGAFAGPALYTDSLLAIASRSGRLDWYDQVTRHDVRDYDFQLSPVLATVDGRPLVLGAGKAGIAIAWDRTTHRRVWETKVGEHRNDDGPLPRRRETVCPGLLGGAETALAYADGTLFVPVVDLCMRGSAVGYEDLDTVNVMRRGRGELVALDAATGARRWVRTLPHADFGCATVADGIVFTSTLDGSVYGFDTSDGATRWSARADAGINSCPALAGNTLLVGAGVPLRGSTPELIAYRPQ
jgi:outer membrane protein assembly factor BamB